MKGFAPNNSARYKSHRIENAEIRWKRNNKDNLNESRKTVRSEQEDFLRLIIVATSDKSLFAKINPNLSFGQHLILK
jgi:hypothetical protein